MDYYWIIVGFVTIFLLLFSIFRSIHISDKKHELSRKSFYTLIEVIEKTDLDKLKNELSIIKEKYKSKNSLEDYYSDIEEINRMIKGLNGKLKDSYDKGYHLYDILKKGENNG